MTDNDWEADEKAILNALYDSRESFSGGGEEVGIDETAILVDHVPEIVLGLGFRRSEVPEPSVEEFRKQIADERARQVDDGYDIIHDRMHGVDHLLTWAQDYARRGRTVQAAALVEAARELIAKSPEPQGEPSGAQVEAAWAVIERDGLTVLERSHLRDALRAAFAVGEGEAQ